MKTATRETYAKRIERVAEYLFDHLDDDLDFHRLAEEAFLSPYHFHRVYRSMTGETATETLRRMRLHRAAIQLISSSAAIATLAKSAGYASVPAFSRAFRSAYGLPPSTYREQQFRRIRRTDPLTRPFATSRHPSKEANMHTVTFETRPSIRVVALAHHGSYDDMGTTFEKLNIWSMGQGIPQNAQSFGIYYDDPASVAAAALRSDACIAVDDSFTPAGEYNIKHTPGGRCAVLIHKGPYSDLEEAYQWFYGLWLPQSGEEPADAPPFEEYLNDPRTVAPTELLTAICLPLKDR